MKFLEGWERGSKNNEFDFGGNADHSPDPRFLDLDYDRDQGIC